MPKDNECRECQRLIGVEVGFGCSYHGAAGFVVLCSDCGHVEHTKPPNTCRDGRRVLKDGFAHGDYSGLPLNPGRTIPGVDFG